MWRIAWFLDTNWGWCDFPNFADSPVEGVVLGVKSREKCLKKESKSGKKFSCGILANLMLLFLFYLFYLMIWTLWGACGTHSVSSGQKLSMWWNPKVRPFDKNAGIMVGPKNENFEFLKKIFFFNFLAWDCSQCIPNAFLRRFRHIKAPCDA